VGGIYQSNGTMMIVSEIIVTALQLSDPNAVESALSNWQYKTSDGAYFFPLPNSVVIYQPSAFGKDVRFFISMAPWPVTWASTTVGWLNRIFKGTPAATFVSVSNILLKSLITAGRTADAIAFAKAYNFNAESFEDVIKGIIDIPGDVISSIIEAIGDNEGDTDLDIVSNDGDEIIPALGVDGATGSPVIPKEEDDILDLRGSLGQAEGLRKRDV
jgi:hypothetical protein